MIKSVFTGFLLLSFALLFQGCGLIVDGVRDEVQRQLILNEAQQLIQGVKTQATIDALLKMGGDRYRELDRNTYRPPNETIGPPPKPPKDPFSNTGFNQKNRVFPDQKDATVTTLKYNQNDELLNCCALHPQEFSFIVKKQNPD